MARKKRGSMPQAMKLEAMSEKKGMPKPPRVSTKVPSVGTRAKTTPAKSSKIHAFNIKAGRVEHAPKPAKLQAAPITRAPKPPKPPKG